MTESIRFVHEDPETIIAEMKAHLEKTLNRQIAPADIEMLLINSFAYRETLIRASINSTARQNLVSFSSGIALEYLGEIMGVTRLPASGAICTMEFKVVTGHTGIVIPEGLRIQSIDGKVIFITIENAVVNVGEKTITAKAVSQQQGKIANGYEQGKISIILDPQPYLESAKNLDTTTGGADDETDDILRQRIKLAPSKFSVAGPTDAYKYFAKSASPSIVDVSITSPLPGQVNIYPLIDGGNLPNNAILAEVQAICNDEKVRPLTDTVITQTPNVEEYEIEVHLTILTNAVNTNADDTVHSKISEWVESRKNRLGMDVIKNKISSISMLENIVYNAEVIKPANNIIVTPEVYTKCNSITVTIIGAHDE